MRFLSAVLLALLVAVPSASAGSRHRTHIVDTDEDTEFEYVRTSDGEHWATLERNGVGWKITDPSVLAQIQKTMDKNHEISKEHSRLGQKHSELGREHSALGREHSRLGRTASRTGMTDELEAEQRKLEAKQRKLEERQRALESEQRALESKQRAVERESRRALYEIFDRAIREGKARRD